MTGGAESSDPRRVCGSCSACCGVIGVQELDKGLYETCEHLCEAGCGIYADRPGACRTFECQWLRGLLEVDGGVDLGLRPDACGVIFDYQPLTSFGEMFTAWEVESGASFRDPARSIIEGLEERFLVMIVTPGTADENGAVERRFVGPPDPMSRARHVVESWVEG